MEATLYGTSTSPLRRFVSEGVELLHRDDPDLHGALHAELQRQESQLIMVASCSVTDPSVLAAMSSVLMNVTAEGYPGARYHAGCRHVDVVEQLAIDRAKAAFAARYVNVQPHSATTANYLVLSSLLRPGDTLLGMQLEHGGHLTHGNKVAYGGQYFHAIGYGLAADGTIDYQQVADLARAHRPRLIICGATAYSRTIDFARFRAIADDVGALLLADISHIAGLVIAGLHPSPIEHAHVTTTCTHKQLAGPRGGLILSGADSEMQIEGQSLAQRLQRAVFPYFQGAPIVPAIAGKARALALAQTARSRAVAAQIVACARALAARFAERGYRVVGGGTDNHIVLLDLTPTGVSGLVAERALEHCGIVVNKNRVPGDTRSAFVTSGVRLGTNTLAQRGLGPDDMATCARLVDTVVRGVRPRDDRELELDELLRQSVLQEVRRLTGEFPIPYYTPSRPDAALLHVHQSK